MKRVQYTIRQGPERGVGLVRKPVEYHDLDELAGSWVADPEIDAAMEAFESIDEALWK